MVGIRLGIGFRMGVVWRIELGRGEIESRLVWVIVV